MTQRHTPLSPRAYAAARKNHCGDRPPSAFNTVLEQTRTATLQTPRPPPATMSDREFGGNDDLSLPKGTLPRLSRPLQLTAPQQPCRRSSLRSSTPSQA